MKNTLFLLATYLIALSTSACSSTFNSDSNKLAEEPLALATEAYKLVSGDENSKMMLLYDLEQAFLASGVTQVTIDHLLKKKAKILTANDKDDELVLLTKKTSNDENSRLQDLLRLSKGIKNPVKRSETLLYLAKKLPKHKRLSILHLAKKAINETQNTTFVYQKRSKLIKLANLYFESSDKKNAREAIISSHRLLIQNTSSSNGLDFGLVAELESQLNIKPNTLCKLTRFLHKTKDRPIALAKITAAYLNQGYKGQICIPDKELIAAVKNMPDASRQVTEQLVLAEAWYAQNKQEISLRMYKGAIESVKSVSSKHYQLDIRTKILISLRKTSNQALYHSFSNDYWKMVNKQSEYEQSSTLMQLVMEAYDIAGLSDLALEALKKMQESSLKTTTGVQLARIAKSNNDPVFAKKALQEAFIAAKTNPYPVPKMDWLREVIDTAYELKDNEIGIQALKVAINSVTKVTYPELKVMYANLLIKQAWKLKEYGLAQELLNKNLGWYEQWANTKIAAKKGAASSIDYREENKKNTLIEMTKVNILLANNASALTLINTLPQEIWQPKALVYAAISLAEKRRTLGRKNTDRNMLNMLKRKIQQIR